VSTISSASRPGRLFVVSTPIGNLADLSHRAVAVLREVSAVLAEDTRHTRVLLDHYDVQTPMVPLHEHNEARSTPAIVARLAAGEDLALVSDAGTPLLSDPGSRLVAAAVEAGIAVVPVPGASALLAALVASGLGANRFTFFGFPPRKGRERADVLAEVVGLPHTAVLYEAPARVADTLAELAAADPDRPAVVARELTKQFEDIRRGTLAELAAYYSVTPPRGEVVVMLAGRSLGAPTEEELRSRARALRADGATPREVVRRLMAEAGAARNLAYRLAHESE
jgi:16S rRNA (cytidine1402-2'-O)-methyltransferase